MSAPSSKAPVRGAGPTAQRFRMRYLAFPSDHPAGSCRFWAYEMTGYPVCVFHGAECSHLEAVDAWIASLGTDEDGNVRWPS